MGWNNPWIKERIGSMRFTPERWAYTWQFEELLLDYREKTGHPETTHLQMYRHMVRLWKTRYVSNDGTNPRIPYFGRGMPRPIPFRAADKAVIRELFARQPYPRDRLPYTRAFDELFAEFVRRTGRLSAQLCHVWHAITAMDRKPGGLPKKGRAKAVGAPRFSGGGR